MGTFKKTNFKRGVTANVQKQRSEQNNFGYLKLEKGMQMLQVEQEGVLELDVLPYIVSIPNHPDKDGEIAAQNTMWYRMPFKVHKNIGSGNDAIICPTTFGQKCPICDYKKKRAAEGADKDELKAYNPSKRSLYAVIPLAQGKKGKMKEINPDRDIYIWDVSDFLFQDMLNNEIDENDDFAVFPDLEEGLTLCIRFEEDSFAGKKFYKANRIDFDAREEGYDESILDEVPVLEKLIAVKSYKEIEAIFLELDEDANETTETIDAGADDEPAPRRRKPAPAAPPVEEKPRRRGTRLEPEPEDDGNDDIDDDVVENACVACGGTGMNSKGRRCPICNGTGIQPEPVDEEDKTPDNYRPARAASATPPVTPPRRQQPPAAAPTTKNKCPFGFRFGIDIDKKKECDECKAWNACSDEAENQ
jgi:hypothetical protein